MNPNVFRQKDTYVSIPLNLRVFKAPGIFKNTQLIIISPKIVL